MDLSLERKLVDQSAASQDLEEFVKQLDVGGGGGGKHARLHRTASDHGTALAVAVSCSSVSCVRMLPTRD